MREIFSGIIPHCHNVAKRLPVMYPFLLCLGRHSAIAGRYFDMSTKGERTRSFPELTRPPSNLLFLNRTSKSLTYSLSMNPTSFTEMYVIHRTPRGVIQPSHPGIIQQSLDDASKERSKYKLERQPSADDSLNVSDRPIFETTSCADARWS